MNLAPLQLEIGVALLGLALLLLELWVSPASHRIVSRGALAGLGLLLIGSFWMEASPAQYAFGQMYVLDTFSLFFKRLFLVAAAGVLLMSREAAEPLPRGNLEYQALVLFALCGMMIAASANDFVLLFVALELISITFYVLIGFQRTSLASLEAGVKYLILSGVASAFLVYGIALIFGSAGTTAFLVPATEPPAHASHLYQVGVLLVLVGLGFKLAAVPFQVWVPDVYQGAPTPTTAFLAAGSKAAGVALLMRVLGGAAPILAQHWRPMLMVMAGLTILYGNLCAIPQHSLKRLLGYSSIANAGYLLLGVVTTSAAGASAILFYLSGYLFSLLAAFLVIGLVVRETQSDDLDALVGLHRRNPILAASLTLAMVSLAGIPPMAGFFGKFLLLKAVVEQGATQSGYYALVAIALVGIVISLYYYFGVVRALYWPDASETEKPPFPVSRTARAALWVCIGGILFLGLLPGPLLGAAEQAVKVFYKF
jgi:NADH-quinone oxidoreductase subunit N